MYYDGSQDFWLGQFDDLTTEDRNNQAAYDLGLYHAQNGHERDTSHCESQAMIEYYNRGLGR